MMLKLERKTDNAMQYIRFAVPFIRNRRGMAATEFALIVPFLVMMYMGAVEIGQALEVDRKIAAIAGATADLVAQSESISQSDVNDIFKVTDLLIAPFDKNLLKITLSSVTSDSDNKQAVDWSMSNSGGEHSVGSQIPGMSASATKANTSVIVAEIQYTYKSPVFYFFTSDATFKDIFYTRPRKSLTVELTN